MNNAMYKEFADNAAFFWFLRSDAISNSSYRLNDITELDQRIEANLDGLMTSTRISWPICEAAMESKQAGEIFTASIVAFSSKDTNKIKKVIAAGLNNDETFKGIVSALGWLPSNIVNPWLPKLLNSKDLDHKYLAIAACSVRREDPGIILTKLFQRDDCIAHTKLYARALRLIGELKRHDLGQLVNSAMSSKNKDIVFWASWSAILLGNTSAVNNLKLFVYEDDCYQEIAIQIVFRVLPVDIARNWISEMVTNKTNTRAIIKSVAVLGDPHAVKWLISTMKQSEYAQIAGEAFNLITGIDLEQRELIIDNIDDKHVAQQSDNTLIQPDVSKITKFWQQFGNKLKAGQRYFLGKLITVEYIETVNLTGNQQQRLGAALELALVDSTRFLINIFKRV